MRWQPDSAVPWLYASDAARGQGDLDRSIGYLHQLPDGDAFSSGALLRLSDLLFHDKGSPWKRPKSAGGSWSTILGTSKRIAA
jgi:hypothetical protein